MPYVALEAFAAACRCRGGVDGARELVEEGRRIPAEVGDARDLARAIGSCWHSARSGASWRGSRRLVLSELTVDHMVRGLIEVYRSSHEDLHVITTLDVARGDAHPVAGARQVRAGTRCGGVLEGPRTLESDFRRRSGMGRCVTAARPAGGCGAPRWPRSCTAPAQGRHGNRAAGAAAGRRRWCRASTTTSRCAAPARFAGDG